MADKILMNKNTLAALKTELKEYRSALPVFEMKEQQLKEAVQAVEESIARLDQAIQEANEEVKPWVGVLAEKGVDVSGLAEVKSLRTEKREVAGVTLEDFVDIEYEEREIDPFSTPLWMDAALELIRDQRTRYELVDLEKKKMALLREELAEARRMKNALKEVFIPETIENIRKIEIYLGDVERLAIGCAKLVKKKKQRKQATP